MPRVFGLIPLTSVLIFTLPMHSQSMPPAPDGFSWVQAKAMKSFFLLPKGWNFLEELKGDTNACFITKEKITPNQGFMTGVSINLIKNVLSKTNLTPSQYAQKYIQVIESKNETIKKVSSKVGVLNHFAIECLCKDEDGKLLHMWHILVANEKTGSLFLVAAESPSGAWASNWPNLEKIISTLGLEDAI